MWLDEQYIAQLPEMDYLSITIKGDWHRPRVFRSCSKTMNFTLFRDNSPGYIELRVARKAITHHDDGGNKFSSQCFYFFGLQRCIPMVRRSHLRFDVYPQGWFFTVLLRTPFLMDCTVRIAISVVLRVRASGSVENPSLCKLLHWKQDYRYGSCCSRFTSVGPINKDHRSVPTIRNRGNAGHRWPT